MTTIRDSARAAIRCSLLAAVTLCATSHTAAAAEPAGVAAAGVVPPGVAASRAPPRPAAPRAPYVPERDSNILQKVPAAADPAVREMAALRQNLTAAPGNLQIASQLAHAYIEYGRKVGDAHYMGYAEAVMAPWLSRSPAPVTALLAQATILQYRHDFGAARAALQAALQQDAKNPQAWLTLATLDMVQGDYAAAAAGCSKVARSGGLVLGLACTGNLRSYTGQAEQSIALLTKIDADAAVLPSSFKGWVHGMLAESSERLGNWTAAEAHYKQALAYLPGDNFLLVAYADFLLDRQRPREVLVLLDRYAEADTAFLRLTLAHDALRTPDAARYTWMMAARFAAYVQRGSEFYGREQVRFALHLQKDPHGALALAQRNWEVQRAPWDARVYLEAALAARQPQAAIPVLAFLRETKLQDPIIEPMARELDAQLSGRLAKGS
jgi:tetratricopeptide (TPR) repeat protein